MKNCLVTLLIGLSLYACQKKVDPVICDLENRTILMSVLLDSLVTQKDLSLAQQQQLDSLNQTPVACLPDATDTIGFNEWQAALNSRWGRQLLGNYEPVKARPYLQTALAAYQRMYPDSVHRDILRMYHNVGLTYSRNRDFFLALSYFDSSDVWTPQVSPRPFIDTKMRKGQAYFALGEYNNALFHLQTAYDSSQQHDNFPTNLQLEIVHSLASTHRLMRQYGLAIELGEKTIRAAGIDRAQPNTLMLANLYLVIGNNWQDSMLLDPANKSVKSEAVWFTTTALRAYENLDDPLGISIAAGNLGELYRRAGDTDIADEILTQTIQQLKRLQADPALFSHLYLNRGETLVGKGNLEKAISNYDSSLHALDPAHQLGQKTKLPGLQQNSINQGELMVVLSDLAQANILLHQKDAKETKALDFAQTVFDTLFKLVNRARGDFVSDQAKLDLAASSQDALYKAFATSLQLALAKPVSRTYYQEQAFRIAEQSKAFVLLESSRLNAASAALPLAFRQKENQLLDERARLESTLYAATDPKQKGSIQLQLQQNFDAIRQYQRELKEQFPKIYATKYEGIHLNIKDLQQSSIASDQALIEYFIQDTALYIFKVTKTTFDLVEVPIRRDTLSRQVQALRKLLERPSWSAAEEAQYLNLAHQLYLKLLAPIANNLSERLLIVPADFLNNLPFETLLSKAAKNEQLGNTERANLVLFQHSVAYAFSASQLLVMQSVKRPPIPPKGPVIFSCTFELDLDQQERQDLPKGLQKNLAFLTSLGINQAREVGEIQELFPRSTLYEGKTANQTNFQEACQENSIIHLVTHGILNEEDPGFSFISFSQMQAQLNMAELFFVKELYAKSDWNLDLIFLSACQTASGQYFDGEGNISMASGLAQAGARSLITTYWNVPTYAKAQIAPLFYEQFIQKKQPKDLALTTAKRLIAQQSNPYDWAGIVLIGATE